MFLEEPWILRTLKFRQDDNAVSSAKKSYPYSLAFVKMITYVDVHRYSFRP